MTSKITGTAIAAIISTSLSTTARSQSADAPVPPKPLSAPTLAPVEVIGKRGTAAEDYRVDRVDSLGPLGSTKLLDTPYMISVLPSDLIDNSQAKNFKDVAKYLPLVSLQEQQGPEILRPQTRGMQGGNFQNSRQDGMTMFVTVANAIEQFQQIEVLNGVSSSLYGPANPSGMFNFVTKRPTKEDLRRVSVGYDSDSIGTARIDVSSHDATGMLGFRVNLVGANGTGYVDGSRLRRDLASVALDLRLAERTVVELNYSDYHLLQKGYPGWFTYGETIQLPKAPDPSKVGYGQSFAGVTLSTSTGSVRVKHDLNDDWHLVAGVLNQDGQRDINTPVNNLTSNSGAYTSSLANGFSPRFVITSDTAYLNGKFSTGGLSHDLVIGTAGYKSQSYAVTLAATAASVLLGTASIDNPKTFLFPAAGLPNTDLNYNSTTTYQQGVNVGDTIGFNDAWSTRLAVSQDWFHTANYNATGAALPSYANSGTSPTVSVIYKPLKNLTNYFTYASSLQAGDVAPGTAANSGAGLSPYRSDEFELGFKASLQGIDLSAAVFRIKRPFANIDPLDKVYKISGNQVNTGLEMTAVGQVVEHLTVYGGLTLLDSRLKDTGVAATDGKRYVGAPKYKGNVLTEYQVPQIPGLVAIFDWQFVGKRPANDTNSFYADGYNLFDIGTRYASRIYGKTVTWRLAVNNIANKHYWSTVAPSTLTGTNTGNLVAHLGSPRTVLASAALDF